MNTSCHQNPHTQNTDQRIDQLLQALGNIEPPSRLEDRVAARVAQLSATTSHPTPQRFFFAAWPVAALAVLILATVALHSHRNPASVAQLLHAPITQPQLATQPPSLAARHTESRSTTAQHRVAEAAPQTPTVSEDPNTIALAETLAPSHPAPPLPLTSQERLMLSILRSGEQEQIAALIPAERDALFAKDQAAFNEYFALKNQPSNTGDQK